MKKLILFFVAVLFAANVSAELRGNRVVSGIFGFSYQPVVSEWGYSLGSMDVLILAPSFQHFITDRSLLGIQVGFMTAKIADADRVNVISADVFGRYYLLRTHNFGVFGQISAGIGRETSNDFSLIGAGIVPGVQYFFNHRWSVEAQLAPVVSFISTSYENGDRLTAFDATINPFAFSTSPLMLSVNFHF